MVKPTSINAYIEHVREGKATTQRERIFELLYKSSEPLSRRQIAQRTGIEINAVCGRVNALLDTEKPFIEVVEFDRDPITGKRVELLKAIEPKPIQRKFVWRDE